MEHLISPKEISMYSRRISNNIDDESIKSYIIESENIDLKRTLGDSLFLDILNNAEKYKVLINGGTYESKHGKVSFSGLKTALAYYVYARIVKNINYNVTRFGFVEKENEFSSRVSNNERISAYNDAYNIADEYMKECVEYLNENKKDYPLYKGHGHVVTGRAKYNIIGD